MKAYIYAQIVVLLPAVSIGFLLQGNNQICRSTSLSMNRQASVFKMSLNEAENIDSQDNDEAGLLLSASDVNAQMAKLRSKYPTSEADYLAAARARNVAKQASSERTATDADWRQIAAEKKQAVGEIDDWESSKIEAGNPDSQILIPLTSTISEDGEEDEPKLMLF
jgi:hypothetical protein